MKNRFNIGCQTLVAAIALAAGSAQSATTTLQITDTTPRRVEVSAENRVLLHSPSEGLWSVATNWEDGWPSGWIHASPEQVERAGDCIVPIGKYHDLGCESTGVLHPLLWLPPPKHALGDRQKRRLEIVRYGGTPVGGNNTIWQLEFHAIIGLLVSSVSCNPIGQLAA